MSTQTQRQDRAKLNGPQLDAEDADYRYEAAELGRKILEIRKSLGLSAREVSEAAGISPSLLSQIERGIASPSIMTLRKIGTALRTPLASFFPERTKSTDSLCDHLGKQLVVRKAGRKRLRVPRSKITCELLTPDLNRQIEFVRIEYGAGAESEDTLIHPGEESCICIEGSITFIIEGTEFALNEGDSISFDSSRPHRIENRTSKTAITISAVTPAAIMTRL